MNPTVNEVAEDRGWLESQLEFVEIELQKPIRVHGQDVTRLRIREPVARDLKAVEGIKGDQSIAQAILARCADVTPGAIGMLRMHDYQRCMEAFSELGFSAPSEQGEELEGPAAQTDGEEL